MIRYEVVNEVVSRTATSAFRQHFWYLTAEFVPLALFNHKVLDDELRQLADRLLALKPDDGMFLPTNRFGTVFGKSRFPADMSASSTFADLVVTVDSWFIFRVLQLQPQFLSDDVIYGQTIRPFKHQNSI